MYDKIKLRVKQTSQLNIDSSNVDKCFFSTKTGVLQGESLSPFLFSMFINDISDAHKC